MKQCWNIYKNLQVPILITSIYYIFRELFKVVKFCQLGCTIQTFEKFRKKNEYVKFINAVQNVEKNFIKMDLFLRVQLIQLIKGGHSYYIYNIYYVKFAGFIHSITRFEQ